MLTYKLDYRTANNADYNLQTNILQTNEIERFWPGGHEIALWSNQRTNRGKMHTENNIENNMNERKNNYLKLYIIWRKKCKHLKYWQHMISNISSWRTLVIIATSTLSKYQQIYGPKIIKK